MAVGFFVSFLCSREHFLAAPDGWVLERTPHYPTSAYLVTTGPYRYSCHPYYVADFMIWFGWTVFYGQLYCGWCLGGNGPGALGPIIVPREERGLAMRFGDAYREFRQTTPRWLGKPRR